METVVEIPDKAVAVCDITRVLSADELAWEVNAAEVARLAAQGVLLSPFDPGPPSRRTRYQRIEAAEWPEGRDPFRVSLELFEGRVEEEPLVPWALEDQVLAARFEASQRASADFDFLTTHSPWFIDGEIPVRNPS